MAESAPKPQATPGQTIIGMVIVAAIALVIMFAWKSCSGTTTISRTFLVEDYAKDDDGFTVGKTGRLMSRAGAPLSWEGKQIQTTSIERRVAPTGALIESHLVMSVDGVDNAQASVVGLSYAAYPQSAGDKTVNSFGSLTFTNLAFGGSDVQALGDVRKKAIDAFNALPTDAAKAKGVTEEYASETWRVRVRAMSVPILGPTIEFTALRADVAAAIGWDFTNEGGAR